MTDELQNLIDSQAGVVARRQLNEHGVDSDRVRNRLQSGRWVELTPRVLGTTTGDLAEEQRRWMAVLHAGPRSMLAGLSAAAVHGLCGWEPPHVSVLVDDELSFEPVDGIDFFRSRRPFDLLRSARPGIPVCRLEPAVLLHAGYEATPRAGHALLAAVVQQRLTTVERLVTALEELRPLRRGKAFRRTLGDIAGGAQSGAELDVGRMCRTHGLPLPQRQVARGDSNGRRRWTDCEWDLPDGSVLVLEVDGSFHAEVRQWSDDLKRARQLTTRRRVLVRCSAYEVRHEAAELAADLVRLGVPPTGPGRVPENAA
jgi:hypothetical protein